MKESEIKIGDRIKIKIGAIWSSEYDNRIATIKKRSERHNNVFTVEMEDTGKIIDFHCTHFIKSVDNSNTSKIIWRWLNERKRSKDR